MNILVLNASPKGKTLPPFKRPCISRPFTQSTPSPFSPWASASKAMNPILPQCARL